MSINKKNPEVEQALEDVARGTLEARRLLISETQINQITDRHSVEQIIVERERTISPDQWRATSVEYAIKIAERRFKDHDSLAKLLEDADTIADYIMLGTLPADPNYVSPGTIDIDSAIANAEDEGE